MEFESYNEMKFLPASCDQTKTYKDDIKWKTIEDQLASGNGSMQPEFALSEQHDYAQFIINQNSNYQLQVNLAMSNLLISNTRHMSKGSSILEHFPYIALYFKHVYVELGYHEISAISKWIFIPKN